MPAIPPQPSIPTIAMASMPGITCTAHGPWWGPMINYIVAAIVTAYALIRLSGGGFLFEFGEYRNNVVPGLYTDVRYSY